MIDLGRIIGFDWDTANARKNEQRGVTQAETEQTFFDPRLLLIEDVKHSDDERRFHALGLTADGRRLHVTFTLRSDDTLIRVISAPNTHRKERNIYDHEA